MLRTYCSPTQIAFFEPLGWLTPIGFILFVGFCIFIGWWWSMAAGGMQIEGPVMWGLAGFFLLIMAVQAWRLFESGLQWFGRMGVVVDREAGTVDNYWGILFTIPWGQRPLAAFDRLVLGQVVTEVTSRSGTRYEIHYELYLAGAGEPLMVGRDSEYGPVRVMAEQLGQFLKMDVLDDGDGSPQLLECGTLGRPAWERDRSALAAYQPLPAAGSLKARAGGKTLHVEFPPGGSPGCLLAGILPAGLLVWLLVYIYNDSKGEAWIPMLIFGGIGGFILLMILSLFLPSTVTVEASPEELVILDAGLFGTSRTRVRAEDVWEVRASGLVMNVITTEGVFMLPTIELPTDTIQRLRIALLHHLAGGR